MTSDDAKKPRDSADPRCLELHDRMKETRNLSSPIERISRLVALKTEALAERCDVTAYAVVSELFGIYYLDRETHREAIKALEEEAEAIEERIFSPADLVRLRDKRKKK
jgi:hypothetical protein